MVACAAAALTLAGCDKENKQDSAQQNAQAATAAAVTPPEAALRLSTGASPAGVPAPVATALPRATPIRYDNGTGDRYAYLDRAYTAAQAFGDAPPDYTYTYGRQQPLAWRSDDGYERVAEQLPGGGLRYYYYQPGAEEPYLVQDPDYSYAYSDGALTVVYDADGNIISDDLARQQADIAARYLARARALYAASVQEHHEAVAQAAWEQQQERVYTDRQRWREKQDQDAAWRAYHDAHLQNEQSHWAMERYRRAAEASRFALTINNTVIVARAAQALSDSSAEARRFGHDVGGHPPSGSLASPGPSTHDQHPPGPVVPDAAPPRGQSSQPPSPPGINSRPQNPSPAAVPVGSQHGPAPAEHPVGGPVRDRDNHANALGNQRRERSVGMQPSPVPAGTATKAPVSAPAPAPPQHAAPTVPADHVAHAPQNRAGLEAKPATPPKLPASDMPTRSTRAKSVSPPAPPPVAPAATQQRAEQTGHQQKPNGTRPASGAALLKETSPSAAQPPRPAGLPPSVTAPNQATTKPPHGASHVAPGQDDGKQSRPHDKKKEEPKPQ